MKRLQLVAFLLAVSLLTGTAGAQPSDSVKFKWREHPSLDIGKVRLDFKGRLEADARLATPDVGRDDAEVVWQSPRVEIAGQIGRRLEFELSRDFGDGEEAAWRDAFVNVRIGRPAEVTAGHFKVPFGRETLVARANLDFINRSLGSSQLTPGRDLGVMVHGRVLGRRLQYQGGYFDRDGDHARTSQIAGARGMVAVRMVARPFADRQETLASGLHFGLAVTASSLDHRLGLRGRTLLEDGVFFDRVYVNGLRRRTGLEAFWSGGPSSLGGEYMVVSDERGEMGFLGDDLPPVRARAWYVAGTWAITGEDKNGRLEPRHALGAVELVARIEKLRFDDLDYPGMPFAFPNPSTLLSNGDTLTTIGVNWYLTRHVRVQYNHVMESIADEQRSPAPLTSGRFTTGILRMQLTI